MNYPTEPSAAAAPDVSEFKKLLNVLQDQTGLLALNSNDINYLSSHLHRTQGSDSKIKGVEVKEINPETVIECLWVEISKIQKANESLRETVEHLKKVIGE